MDIFSPSDTPLTVTVLVLPGSSMMSVACTIDPMRAANRMAHETVFDWSVHTLDGASAVLSCELPLSIDSKFDSAKGGNILIIIAGFDSNYHAGKDAVPRIASAAAKYDAVGGVDGHVREDLPGELGPLVLAGVHDLDLLVAALVGQALSEAERVRADHPDGGQGHRGGASAAVVVGEEGVGHHVAGEDLADDGAKLLQIELSHQPHVRALAE